MPTIKPADFTSRGWKEHYSGFPKDLFYAKDGVDNSWLTIPHLHVNYAIGGALQSMTYKNVSGVNTYLFSGGSWDTSEITKLHFSPLKKEIDFVKDLS